MVAKKVPVVIVRKATKSDLPILNEKFYSDKEEKLEVKDAERIIVYEINGKIRGMGFYDPNTQSFFDKKNSIIPDEALLNMAKYEIEKPKRDREIRNLIKKYGVKKLGEMYEKKMDELAKKLNKKS